MEKKKKKKKFNNSMQAIINPKYHKTFIKSIYCLARIGSDLIIEGLDNSLCFRVLSATQSAYAYFLYQINVFERYKCNKNIKCKVNIKNLLSSFKGGQIQNIKALSIILNNNEMIIKLTQNNSIKRVYKYTYETLYSVLSVDYDSDGYHCMVFKPSIFVKGLLNYFDRKLEEIQINCTMLNSE